MNGLFVKVPHSKVVQQMSITLWDVDDDGFAVWNVAIDGDERFVEGRLEWDVWQVVDAAVKAYEPE